MGYEKLARSKGLRWKSVKQLGAIGLMMALLTACGAPKVSAPAQTPQAPQTPSTAAPAPATGADLEAAKKEGTLVVWHGDQEPDIVEFLKRFTQKTGIKVEQQRLLPGAALPKLHAELKAGGPSADVWMVSDIGIVNAEMVQGTLMQYNSPELKAYAPQYKSSPEGFYTTYFINVGPIMYNPEFVSEAEAPKTYTDLLDPKWKDQVGFQNSSAGTQFAWWYLLKDHLPADYWDRLANNKPRAYNSSTQQLQDLLNGDLKIGGKVSIFQYTKAVRQGQSIKMVMPPEGVSGTLQVAAILAGAKHPNAAKVFMDYLLTQEGQLAWNDIQGSYSARTDVVIKELPPMASLKLFTPTDFKAFGSAAKHEEFVKLWNKISGLQ